MKTSELKLNKDFIVKNPAGVCITNAKPSVLRIICENPVDLYIAVSVHKQLFFAERLLIRHLEPSRNDIRQQTFCFEVCLARQRVVLVSKTSGAHGNNGDSEVNSAWPSTSAGLLSHGC